MKKIYYDTSTTFLENSRMKQLRKSYCEEHGLEESKFIRETVYKAMNFKKEDYESGGTGL